MVKLIYKVVRHDGGWAYQADGTYSETFPSHETARSAAMRAVREQAQPGDAAGITYEDLSGHWHEELADGADRPETTLED